MKIRSRAAGKQTKIQRMVAECPTCHAKVTAEEIEVGLSLTCPLCEDNSDYFATQPIRLDMTKEHQKRV